MASKIRLPFLLLSALLLLNAGCGDGGRHKKATVATNGKKAGSGKPSSPAAPAEETVVATNDKQAGSGKSSLPAAPAEEAVVITKAEGKGGDWQRPARAGETVVATNGAVRFVVQGEFLPTIESARESALRAAQDRLRDWFSKQTPPIRYVPGIETIRRDMKIREDSPLEEPILNQKDRVYKITMEIEVPPKLIRSCRERDRVASGMWTLGGILGILGLVVLFFRLDEWTKGYLTRWLITAGVIISIAIMVILLWAN